MQILKTLRLINEHGTPSAVLALLLGAATAMHFLARAAGSFIKTIPGYPSSIPDELIVCRIRAVEFVHVHTWLPLLFAAVAIASLLWLKVRKAPHWSVWIALIFYSLPCLAYAWVCLKASILNIGVLGPAL